MKEVWKYVIKLTLTLWFREERIPFLKFKNFFLLKTTSIISFIPMCMYENVCTREHVREHFTAAGLYCILNAVFMPLWCCGEKWWSATDEGVVGPCGCYSCKQLFFLLPVYRIKFNESFAEMNRSTNEWKTIVGTAMFFIGFTALILIWEKHYGE